MRTASTLTIQQGDTAERVVVLATKPPERALFAQIRGETADGGGEFVIIGEPGALRGFLTDALGRLDDALAQVADLGDELGDRHIHGRPASERVELALP